MQFQCVTKLNNHQVAFEFKLTNRGNLLKTRLSLSKNTRALVDNILLECVAKISLQRGQSTKLIQDGQAALLKHRLKASQQLLLVSNDHLLF